MTKSEARALVARLSRETATLRDRLILAPLLPGGRIRTRIQGLVQEFRVREPFAGWGRFRPQDDRIATLVGEAQPWERCAYLALFPALQVLLLWPDRHRPGTWWALPCNASDAHQRFGLSGDPLPVRLCDPLDGAERFAQVLARVDGHTLWYDGPDPRADPSHADWLRTAAAAPGPPDRYPSGISGAARAALLLSATYPDGVPPLGHADLWLTRQGSDGTVDRSVEGRLRRALNKADASLHSFSETSDPSGTPGSLLVEWGERGGTRRYRTLLDRDLTVVSSGICLSGQDHHFDLTSLVSVMTDAEYQ